MAESNESLFHRDKYTQDSKRNGDSFNIVRSKQRDALLLSSISSENNIPAGTARKRYVNGKLEVLSEEATDKRNVETNTCTSKEKNKQGQSSKPFSNSESKPSPQPCIEIVSLKSVEKRNLPYMNAEQDNKPSTNLVSKLIKRHEQFADLNKGSDETSKDTSNSMDPVMSALDSFQPYDEEGLDTIAEETGHDECEQRAPNVRDESREYKGEQKLALKGFIPQPEQSCFSKSNIQGAVSAGGENHLSAFTFQGIDDDFENEPLIQTLMRQDSSENVVIEIKPKQRIESPTIPILQEQKRSKSVENLSPKDYLVVRANRKMAIKAQMEQENSVIVVGDKSESPHLSSVASAVRCPEINEQNTGQYYFQDHTLHDTMPDHATESTCAQNRFYEGPSQNHIETQDCLLENNFRISDETESASKYNYGSQETNNQCDGIIANSNDDTIFMSGNNEEAMRYDTPTKSLRHTGKRSRAASYGSDQNDAEVAEILRNIVLEQNTNADQCGLIVVTNAEDCSSNYRTSDDTDFRDDYSDCAYSDAGDYITYKTFVRSCDLDSVDQFEMDESDLGDANSLEGSQNIGSLSKFQTKLREVENLLKSMNDSIDTDYNAEDCDAATSELIITPFNSQKTCDDSDTNDTRGVLNPSPNLECSDDRLRVPTTKLFDESISRSDTEIHQNDIQSETGSIKLHSVFQTQTGVKQEKHISPTGNETKKENFVYRTKEDNPLSETNTENITDNSIKKTLSQMVIDADSGNIASQTDDIKFLTEIETEQKFQTNTNMESDKSVSQGDTVIEQQDVLSQLDTETKQDNILSQMDIEIECEISVPRSEIRSDVDTVEENTLFCSEGNATQVHSPSVDDVKMPNSNKIISKDSDETFLVSNETNESNIIISSVINDEHGRKATPQRCIQEQNMNCSITKRDQNDENDTSISDLKFHQKLNVNPFDCRKKEHSQSDKGGQSTKPRLLTRNRDPRAVIKHRSKIRVERKVKGQDRANLVARRNKLYSIIHGLNKHRNARRYVDELANSTGDLGDDMIWNLLKGLVASTGEALFAEDEKISTTDGEECDAASSQSDIASPPKQEKDNIKVVTYLSPVVKIKSRVEFTPLVSPKKNTLPFNVQELFMREVNKAKQIARLRSNMKELKLITGGSVTIVNKNDLQEDVASSSKNEETSTCVKRTDCAHPGVVTQSVQPLKMSAQLILPKLNLIGQPTPLHSEVTSTTSEQGVSKEKLNSNQKEKESSESDDEMGQQECDNSLPLDEILLKAQEMLNSSRLDDAETTFLKLYQQMQEKPEDNTKILVQTLTGLADICTRKSRMCRSNPMEWQWLCMHSISLLQYTIEICDSELDSLHENQDVEWYQEQKHSIEFKCRPLEDSFNRALYNCLKHEGRKFMDPFRSFSFPNTPTTSQRLGNFPLSTGNQYSMFPGMNYRYSSTLQDNQTQTVDDTNIGLDWLTKFNQYCNDRFQSKNLGDIFHKIFRKRNKRENHHHEDDTESVVSDSAGSLDWDHNDLQGIEELDFEPICEEPPTINPDLEFEFTNGDIEDDGWDFFLHDRKGCKFESVVQVASQKEMTEKAPNREVKEVKQNHAKSSEKEMISPLHEHSIKLTLAKSYSKLAEKLISEEEFAKSEMLLEQVLKIIDEIQDGTAGMLKFNAQVLKNLGTVKSKLGKAIEGLEYLNKALETYKDLHDDCANFEIAVALLELGNGYVVGKNNDDGVYEDAIGAICEFFEKDLSDEQMTSSSSSGKSDATSTHRSPEEEENIEEAIHCYKEVLSLLQSETNVKRMDVVAKATMRLGDCYFMQKDYDQALECFEKALSLYHKSSTLGRELLIDQAHVMCMVGVSTFMLHMYPKAASTFELALHMVKYAFGLSSTFLHGLLLSMMGITYYKMKNYHRCVSVCYQGFEIFCNMHGDKLPSLPKRKFWLVCQILYVMGVSYNNLNLHLKAIKYLTVARTLMMACKMRERRQFMRVLQILGDCYFAQYDYKTALQFYNEALEYGDCESQISFDEVFDPNTVGDNMTMHNQLVSKSAEAHISMQQYQNAVHYLEQAHDMQEDMGNDIKGDLINTLNQLGQMHSMAGDVDQAIDSFNESVEVYKEVHGNQLGADMSVILGNLGTMYYVKACICDQIDEELEMILKAEKYFQDAMALEANASVSVKYGNFLYSQANYEDAIMYLDEALKIPDIATEKDIVYGGLEKVTLPDCLQDEVDCQEEVVLSPSALALYLLVLSHKMLGQLRQAERYTMYLMRDVLENDIPILYSVLGYALMELGLFEEALWGFSTAIEMESEYQLAKDNYNLCLCICAYQTLMKGVENICLFYKLPCYYTT